MRESCSPSTFPAAAPRPVAVRKDVLRVGRWRLADGSTWTVTPETLRRLAAAFGRFRAAGHRVPWLCGHDGGAADRIGDVTALSVVGDRLYATCTVLDPAVAARFGAGGEAADEVSVEVARGWTDGAGRRYDLLLTHVATVLHPVVPHQGPFVRLGRCRGGAGGRHRLFLSTWRKPMNENEAGTAAEEPDAEPQPPADAETFSVADVIGVLGRLGVTLAGEPRSRRELLIALENTLQVAAEPQPATPGNDDTMSLSLAADRYGREVDRLVAANCLSPAEGADLKRDAAAGGSCRLSLLEPLRRLPPAATPAGRGRTLPGRGDGLSLTPERVREIARS